MTKSAINKTWFGGLAAVVIGLVVAGGGLGLMFAFGGSFEHAATGNGYDFVPNFGAGFWSGIGFVVFGGTLLVAGALVQMVAWIGALMNTFRLVDKTWFVVLLATGVLGLGFGLVGLAGMVAYLVAGPDGTAVRPPATPIQPRSLAPSL